MICYSFAPQNDPDGLMGIWDEFRQGVDTDVSFDAGKKPGANACQLMTVGVSARYSSYESRAVRVRGPFSSRPIGV